MNSNSTGIQTARRCSVVVVVVAFEVAARWHYISHAGQGNGTPCGRDFMRYASPGDHGAVHRVLAEWQFDTDLLDSGLDV